MTEVLINKGSSKDVYKIFDENENLRCLRFSFSDRVSVFDVGPVPIGFPGLGKIRCAIAGRLFTLLQQAGHETHYITHDVDRATMDVFPLNVAELELDFKGAAIGSLIPAEILFRYIASQGFMDRVQQHRLRRSAIEPLLVGERGLEVGARFEPAFVECSTKFEAKDRYLTDLEAIGVTGLSIEQMTMIHAQVRDLAAFLKQVFRSAGFDLMDGKFEGGLVKYTNTFILADSVSPDELRLVGIDGVQHDKDFLRKWYTTNQSDWLTRLKAAQKDPTVPKSDWPTYEAVPPPSVVNGMVDLYYRVAKALNAM